MNEHFGRSPRTHVKCGQRIVKRRPRGIAILCCLAVVGPQACRAAAPAVQVDSAGKLVYSPDVDGNRIPDFSHCGYNGGDGDLPAAPVRVVVTPSAGDDGTRIQGAVDYVAQLPKDDDGFRGAVRLAPGQFHIGGAIKITASGIVLQGSGASEGGTTIVAAGRDRRALIQIMGGGDRQFRDHPGTMAIQEDYVPVGANQFRVASTDGISVGDSILITRPSTAEWFAKIGGQAPGVQWKSGTRDLHWDRTVTRITGDGVVFDAPITTSISKEDGGGTVQLYDWPDRIERVGIEDLRLVSEYRPNRPRDEDHAWFGVAVDNAKNAWVRRMAFHHFAGGAVSLGHESESITVEDCIALEPVSEIGGYRRQTFFTLGQTTLFHRCWSEMGRHDFSTGQCAAGPNAFVNCYADRAHGPSGPIESWSSGVLYDNVRIDGNDLQLKNLWDSPPRAGWAAANCVLWQCRAATARCFRPPGANNWAVGVWATPAGDGTFESLSDFVRPFSLYQAQLRQRIGDEAAARVEFELGKPVGATNPTYAEAARFVEQSRGPAKQLIDAINDKLAKVTAKRTAVEGDETVDAVSMDQLQSQNAARGTTDKSARANGSQLLTIENGWIAFDSQLKTGRRLTPTWWRGTIHPTEAAKFGPNITRYVPGRRGVGLTDDLQAVADLMVANDTAVYEHHYGLWYDRRRDDHLMVRRADGAVAPPFYEQPFARSGHGFAWDGLSKYDLTSYNPWYWDRLRRFAKLCDQRGLVLVHHNYFQHNILEAGAHWVDCPWRPANNVNDAKLPDPPPYIGDKRLFMAQHFYDIENPKLRTLHRRYIRQCLDAFADCSNVIQMTSAEYTGPLAFTQFWLDTVIEWERERKKPVFIALSCTKDVQDAILADPQREPHVDVVDIRYWTYDKNFKLYAPEGGKHLAPRQHMRQLKPEASSFASIVKAVRDYREKFPTKAVLYNADRFCRSPNEGWAVLMGGGSLPNVKLPSELSQSVMAMSPVKVDIGKEKVRDRWALEGADGAKLVYAESLEESFDVPVHEGPADYRVRWIDAETGKLVADNQIRAESMLHLKPASKIAWILPVGEAN